jgi:hypothetical protein
VERLSTNWKGFLTTALPIVFAVLVFLPGHPRVRAANSVDDDIVTASYDFPELGKPSPFPVIAVRQYHPAPRAATPLPEAVTPVAVVIPPGVTFPSESSDKP